MRVPTRRDFFVLCGFAALVSLRTAGAVAADSLKITVYGGSGRIGQRIVNEALNRGHTVTVVVRDPSRMTQKHERLTVVKGDVLDTKAVAQHMAGQDAIVSTVSGFDQGPDFFPKAAQSLASAARSLGASAPRVLWVGGASSLATEPGGKSAVELNPSAPPFQKGQLQVVNFFRSTDGVKWTVLTPPSQIEPGERTAKFRLGKDVLLKDPQGRSRISMEDFAVAMMDEIEKPQHLLSRFTVAY